MRTLSRLQYLFLLLLPLLAVCCKEKYIPPVIAMPERFLVVDGFINSGQDSTIIFLTRSRNLGTDSAYQRETGAVVSVEGKSGDSHPLQEAGPGKYIALSLNLNGNENYQLKIRTQDGRAYLSDPVPVQQTPDIDSIGWKTGADGLTVYANAHDPNGAARYYRYEFSETWQYHSLYYSPLIYKNGDVTDRDSSEEIYYCWKTLPSTFLVLATSAGLSQDIIYQAPVNFIPSGDDRLSIKYSILVKQYALTRDAFIFWQNLQKNTEGRGSLFDAQPSQAVGNIHCLTDPSEPVIGYISANSISQKRIFISNADVPGWPDTRLTCDTLLVKNDPASMSLYFTDENYIPVAKQYAFSVVVGYYSFAGDCVDCKLNGGMSAQPLFWQ